MLIPPAFILSSPRSGSTLFRVMLAGHPDLFCPPELNLLPFATMAERDRVLGRCGATDCQDLGCDARDGLLQALMELTGEDVESARRRVADLIGDGAGTAEAYRLMAELAAPRRVVDKSPLNVARIAWMRRAEEIGPGARYLHLVRHPAAVLASLMRQNANIAANPEAALLAELVWTTANRNVVSFLANVPPERQHLVHYEELVTDPATIMAGVLKFLDLPPHDGVLDPYQGNRMTAGFRPGTLSLGDPRFLTHDGIDPTLAEAWRTAQLPYGLGEPAVELAGELDYDEVDAGLLAEEAVPAGMVE